MTNKKGFYGERFESIQALRGIAALFVVLEHIQFINRGAFGVDIFFCISGFIMMFTTHRGTNQFFRKRLLRIVPFYYLMTLATFGMLVLFPSMFEQTQASLSSLVKSLLFIPFDVGNGAIMPILRVGWTINYEMFFYLIFGICAHLSHKYRGVLAGVVLGGIVLAGALVPSSRVPFQFYSNPIILEFILGILVYYVAHTLYELREKGKLPTALPCVAAFAGVALTVGLFATAHEVRIEGIRRIFVWGLPAFLLILCVFMIGMYVKIPTVLVWLGDISFSVYLIHYYPVMLLGRRVFDFSVCTPHSVLGAAVTIPVVIGLAWIAWFIIEKTLTGWLKPYVLRSRQGK